MVFKQRESCINKQDGTSKGNDVKSYFTAAFILGFILHLINFTLHTFVEPVLRLTALKRDPSDKDAPRYSTLLLIGFGFDIVFRGFFIAFSIWQLLFLGKDSVTECMAEK